MGKLCPSSKKITMKKENKNSKNVITLGNFPLYKIKMGGKKSFRLEDPKERAKYFKFKAGKEIAKLRKYLEKNTFVCFLMGKKNSGKGTHSKLFMEAVGSKNIAHISVGDIVRSVHKDLKTKNGEKELIKFLNSRYRGFMSIDKALDIILGRDLTSLLPTEIILALVEREIDRLNKKAVFIDGFPRNLDQISYSLYFRALMGYRDDPDMFVFIDVPESIIEERIKNRVICPRCKTPRSLKLMRTREAGYDEKTKEFFLMCDNNTCQKDRMVSKEGDSLGIEAIRDRIEVDDKVSSILLGLEGVPKIYIRNPIPVTKAKELVDEYELTPEYVYHYDSKSKKVTVTTKPWIIKDQNGVRSHSLLPAAIVISLIKQMTKALNL